MAGISPVILLTMQNRLQPFLPCGAVCQPSSSRAAEGTGLWVEIPVLSCHDLHAFENSSSIREGKPRALSPLPRFAAVELGNLPLTSQP